MRFNRLVVVCLALFAARTPAAAQQDTSTTPREKPPITHVLKTREGSTLLGRLVADSGDTVRFQTSLGMLAIPKQNVAELKPVKASEVREGQYWFPDPNRTRLFFAPTGRMLSAGEGYYSNTYLFLQNFAGGASDHVTLGGGLSLFPTGDMSEQVYYFTPKVGVYNTEQNNVAIGGILAWVPTDNGKPFGIVYGVGTHGGPDGSVSGGLGYGFYGSDMSSRPAAMVGGARRVSQRLALLTENYGMVYDDTQTDCVNTPAGFTCTDSNKHRLGVLSMYGVRFLGEKLSVDLALANVATHDTHWIFPGVPYVAFAVKF